MNEIALRQHIGRMASVVGPDDQLADWASENGEDLFIVPALPDDGLNESIAIIHNKGYKAGVLVTVVAHQEKNRLGLGWITVKSVGGHDDSGHLPTSPSTTVGDLLKILLPGSSMTIRLGMDELVFQPSPSTGQITDKKVVKSLRQSISA